MATLVCDSGNKYLSKMFNDHWMTDQGFLDREQFGDLRDLISRRIEDRAVVSVAPDDDLLIAYGRMKLSDVSQVPVLKGDQIVGIIDKSDLLLALYHNEQNFKAAVGDYMTSKLEVISPGHQIEDVLPILRADRVVIVVDDDRFLGLITKVDLINHLRRKLK